MKKKTTEISINTSSGAEKVERIEKELGREGKKTVKKSVQAAESTKGSAKGDAALGDSVKKEEKRSAAEIKRINAKSTDGKAEQESEEAKARVEKALAKKESQQKRKEARKQKAEKRKAERKKRLAEKKAIIEKRAAEKKARAEKHAAERKALAEKRKAEKEEKLRQRAHEKANRNNANYKKKKAKEKHKSEKRENRTRQDNRNKGYGGWIAAVVSLGVVSLALATTVTVGAIEMNKGEMEMMGAQKSAMYELTGIMDNVDNDLDRVRISNSPVQQSRILTDLLVQTRLAELDLEKMPVAAEMDANITSFINRTASFCEEMLAKLRKGEPLSAKDREQMETLYQINHTVRMELDEMTMNMTDKDISAFMKKGEGKLKSALERIEKSTLDENKLSAQGDKAATAETPKSLEVCQKQRIEAAKAEELCTKYFKGYNIADFQCIGETVGGAYEAYNVQGYDEKGNQLFAEISQADGALLRFDYYEECAGENFALRNAEKIADEFLEKLGYDDMEVVRFRNNGSTTDFTFVYEDEDVVFYPDEIRVKVCRTRGVVSGFDATKYLQNHKERDGDEVKVKLSLADAYKKLREGLTVESSRLTVIQTDLGERAAYEFLCGYNEESYFVFLDAVTGEEISIVNTKSIA